MKQSMVDLVWNRAQHRCEYCLFPASHAWLPFQLDHIVAEKHGGQSVAENLALSCFYCNSFKGPNIAGIDPDGAPDVAIQLFHPRKNIWSEHFGWKLAILIGNTSTGRATISVLRMNDPAAIEFRELLIDVGHGY